MKLKKILIYGIPFLMVYTIGIFEIGHLFGYKKGNYNNNKLEYDRGLSAGFMLGYTKSCLDNEEN